MLDCIAAKISIHISLTWCILAFYLPFKEGTELIPKNPRLTVQGHRTLEIAWDKVPNFNKTGTADQELYLIKYSLVYTPSHKVQSVVTSRLFGYPILRVQDLLLNTTVQFSVATKFKKNEPESQYSPVVRFSTTNFDPALNVAIPGKVTNITIEVITSHLNISFCKINWNTPANLIHANHQTQSVQYTVMLCNYNTSTNQTSGCRVESETAALTYRLQQSTLTIPSLFTRMMPIRIPRNKDVAIVIYATALNGNHGKSEQLVTKLGSSTEPHAPSNVKFYMKNNSTEVVLTWSSNVKGKFLVEYGVFDDYTATKKSIFTSLTTTTIKGLSIGNTYAVRILIHSSPYGRSTFSTPVMITMPPGNTPSSFTKIKEDEQPDPRRSRTLQIALLGSGAAVGCIVVLAMAIFRRKISKRLKNTCL